MSVTIGGQPAGSGVSVKDGSTTPMVVAAPGGGPYAFAIGNVAVARLALASGSSMARRHARVLPAVSQTLTSQDGKVDLIAVAPGKTRLTISNADGLLYRGTITVEGTGPTPTPSPSPTPTATPTTKPTPTPTTKPTATPTTKPTATPTTKPTATPTTTPTPGVMTVGVVCAQTVDACSNGTKTTPGSVQFTAVGDTATLTPSETGSSTTFTLKSDTCNTTDDRSTGGNWATFSPGVGEAAVSFTVTAKNAGTSGNVAACSAVIANASGQTVTIDVGVTLGNIGVNTKRGGAKP